MQKSKEYNLNTTSLSV